VVTLEAFIALALLVEAMTQITKSILSKLGVELCPWMDQTISLVFSVAMAVFGKIDFFSILNEVLPVEFNFPAILGIILSALVLSRGSNAVHDILDILRRLNPQGRGQSRLW